MKQIFTTAILVASCLAATAEKANAQTDRPSLIREDRVWESLSCSDSGIPTSHFFKFDGTEERDGKTYGRLIAFKKVTYTYANRPEGEVLDKEDGIEELHALMREEDGVVYSYIDDSCVFTGECEGELKNHEYVLYDFNANESETYDSAGFFYNLEVYPAYFKVSSLDYVEVGGEKCKRMMVSASESKDDPRGMGDYEIVEGIGFTDKGCLFYHGYFCQETSMYFKLYFLRVFDLDGNILYGDREWITPDGGIQVGVEGMAQPTGGLSFDDREINIESSRPCKINLVDMQGAPVASTTGTGHISLPLTGLQRGVYVATAESDGRVIDRMKIIYQK